MGRLRELVEVDEPPLLGDGRGPSRAGDPSSVRARSMIVRAGVVIGTPWCIVASNVRVR